MRVRSRLVLDVRAVRRRRSAALWTALGAVAVTMSVFLPWYRWDPGEGSRWGGPREFSDPLQGLHGYVEGITGHFLGRYSAALGLIAAVGAACTCMEARGTPGRGSRRLALAVCAAMLGALLLTAADLLLEHGSDLTPMPRRQAREGWLRSFGAWITLGSATFATTWALLLLRRTRNAAETSDEEAGASEDGRRPRRAACGTALCAIALAFAVLLPWYGDASSAERAGPAPEVIHGWSGFGFFALGLLVFVASTLACASATRLFPLTTSVPEGPPREGARKRWAVEDRDDARRLARFALAWFALALAAVVVDWVWFYRRRDMSYGSGSERVELVWDKQWGIHFSLAVAVVGVLAAWIAWRAVARAPATGEAETPAANPS